MRCDRWLLLLALVVAVSAEGGDMRVISGGVMYESGLAAPTVELRSIGEDGSVWRGGITGWTLALVHEKPVERGQRLVFAINATPRNAHASDRVYRDGQRVPELEFENAALDVRGGMRIRQGEHAWFEPAIVLGIERLGDDAGRELRDAWRSPYVGVAVSQRLRFVTADDPLRSRLDGVDVTITAEAYHGNRTWTRATISEVGGLRLGRLHLRQSVAVFGGSGLDTVNAFLVGGSWDALGAMAVYGRRYAEYRVARGANASAGADLAVTRSVDVGIRGSAFRGASQRATGVMVLVTQRIGGFRVGAGVARSDGRTTVTATFAGAMVVR